MIGKYIYRIEGSKQETKPDLTRESLGQVSVKVELGVLKVDDTSGSSNGLGMQLSVLGLGLCNKSLLLGKVVGSLLSGSSRLQGGVVDEAVTDTGAQGSPSQNLLWS